MGDMADWIIEQGEIPEVMGEVTSEPYDKISNCDKCGKQMMFNEGTVYYSNGIPLLLCPECAERKDEEDFA